MLRIFAPLVAALVAGLPVAVAVGQGGAVDPALLEKGRGMFEANCSDCHQSDGTGAPPTFPALAGNERLQMLELIVGNVHNGKNMMPAFDDFTAEDIAALATYVRNSWGNGFGGVTPEQVQAILDTLG